MGMPKNSSKLNFDFSSVSGCFPLPPACSCGQGQSPLLHALQLLGPLFFCWVVQLLLPTFLQQLVCE